MRVFIAVQMDDDIKDYIMMKQSEIKKYISSGSLTRSDNFHITLRFLGELDAHHIESIKRAMDDTASLFENFTFTLGKPGAFSRGNESILWLGVQNGYAKLKRLWESLNQSLEIRGFARETRSFSPHITLGRRIALKRPISEISDDISIENKYVEVKAITLMESRRIDGILRYIPIYSCDLK